jgi:hypothetical protein
MGRHAAASTQWLILNVDACVKESASLSFCTASLALDDASRKYVVHVKLLLPLENTMENVCVSKVVVTILFIINQELKNEGKSF